MSVLPTLTLWYTKEPKPLLVFRQQGVVSMWCMATEC